MINRNFDPIVFKDIRKEKIQRQAYDAWAEKEYNGTMEIATGVGKTLIGLMAIQQDLTSKWWIVVPKVDLMMQWREEIHKHLGGHEVGFVGDGYKQFDYNIVVAVVNSVRDMELKGNLIMDEIHRYGSEENFKFLENGNFKKILGLTATSVRQDGAHKKLFQYAPLVFSYSQKRAIDEGLLSGFELINMMVGLTGEERGLYMQVDNFIKQNFSTFHFNLNEVQNAIRGGGVLGSIAADLMRAFNKRRTIILNAESKITKTVEIIEEVEGEPKTLVFCEYIKTADKIVELLEERKVPAGKYHSSMDYEEKMQMLQAFKDGKIKVMVTVKSLDEGTNVPDIDAIIITAGSGVPRQMIQRMGRGLRTFEGKEDVKIYQLYIPNTKDYDWMKARYSELVKNAKKVRWI